MIIITSSLAKFWQGFSRGVSELNGSLQASRGPPRPCETTSSIPSENRA
jgi:hypothetical protein